MKREQITATVIGTDNGTRGGLCPLEHRFIRFRLADGRIVKWWTEKMPEMDFERNEGTKLQMTAIVSDKRTLQRVKIISA